MNLQDHIAVLTGNGTSIYFNRDLALRALTAEIKHQLGPQQSARLLAMSADFGTADADDFEALLGPLDTWDAKIAGLAELDGFAQHIDGERSFRIALETIRDRLSAVRRHGVSHALEVIDNRSYATWNERAPLERFFRDLKAACGRGRVRVGNLNYDCLNLAAMNSVFGRGMCDMAQGTRTKQVIVPGEPAVEAFPIRTTPNLIADRHQLVHLHGSTGWLRDPKGVVWKVCIDDVRRTDFWAAYRDKRTEWSPVVVLTNQARKSTVVERDPFHLGYQVFGEALRTSGRWLLVGYSFRDEAVNDLLAKAYRQHATPPGLLVITKGDFLTRKTVRQALHLNDTAPLTILRNGLGDAPGSKEWNTWAATLPPMHGAA